jgi:hypothetical protein
VRLRSASRVAGGAACVALIASAAACRTPVSSDRLEGRWVGVRAEGPGADGVPGADAFATGVELEFRRNEIFVTSARQSQAGRYEVVKEDANAIVITTDRDGPGHPQTFTVRDDDTLRWAILPGRTLVFARD